MTADAPLINHDPLAPFRVPGFPRYWAGNLLLLIGMQMQMTAVQWEIYSRTNSNLDVGFASLLQFLPVLLLSIPAGVLADRFPRAKVVQSAMTIMILGSLLLAAASYYRWPLPWFYAGMLLNGMAKAAQQPSKASLLPQIVPRGLFPAAVTWFSGSFQVASVLGPALAAVVIATVHPSLVYVLEASAAVLFILALFGIRAPVDIARTADAVSWNGLAAGLRFVWQTRIILAAISLDLFAVLLGGATVLLPAYSRNILPLESELSWVPGWGTRWGFDDLDPRTIGFGAMRAAPAAGAIAMSIWLAMSPSMKHAGRTLLWSVAGFGAATIVFGLSRSFWLSLGMLFLIGALDMISVVVRHTLVQLRTPDEMRGRVQAINGLFIGASNELGGFESGAVAAAFARENNPAFGPTVSVVSGGIGTIVIVALTTWLSPGLRRYKDLHHVPEEESLVRKDTKASSSQSS